MNIEKLKLALEILNLMEGLGSPNSIDNSDYPLIGQYVIVRTYSAGNFAGTFEKKLSDGNIILKDCRRLWRWQTANNGISLSEIAQYGINPLNSKICCVEPYKIITPIEISPVSEIAKKTIVTAKDYICDK